jgi:predicted outer membrane repeat protein
MRNILLTILLFFIALHSQATQHIVTSTEDNADTPTEGMLRYAIENASNGDTILFSVAVVNLDTALRISGGVLTMDGGSGVTINGNQKDRVFNISCYSSSDNIIIKNISIENGKIDDSSAMGGGMYAYILSGNLLVEDCTFKNNTIVSNADGQGGALRTQGGTFQNCFFLNNEVIGTASALGGGGVYSIGGTFINCVVAGNTAKYGGGIYASSSTEFINCTVTQNNASNTDAGGGISCEDNCSITNTILYNNKSNAVENNIDNYLGTSTFSYCAVEDGNSLVGTNNNIGLSATPFAHTGEDSLSIYKGSVCENAGTTSGITVLSEDIIGNNRVSGSSIDIGAYEYNIPLYDSITVTNNSFDPAVEYSLPWAIEHADSACIITFDNNYHIAFTDEIKIDESITIDGSGFTVELDGNSSTRIFSITGTNGDTIYLKNLLVKNGFTNSSGGGIVVYSNEDIHINLQNCAFEKNISAYNSGGGISINASCTITNCTFYKNKAKHRGGAVYLENGSFTNCLFYDNSARDINDVDGNATFSHCASNYILPGENNVQLWTNPFVGESGPERLHLNDTSYCSNVGTADTLSLNLSQYDLAGNQRVLNDTIDIGAFESNYLATPPRPLYKNITVTNNSFDGNVENSILWALAHAGDSCIIKFSSDFTVNVTNEISIGNKSLTIDGSSKDIVLDGGDSTRIFSYIGKPSTEIHLKSLTIQNGNSEKGGGFLIGTNTGGKVLITHCLFQNNNATNNGGAIYILPINSTYEGVSISGSVFTENYAGSRGGAIHSTINTWTSGTIGNFYTNCTFTRNQSGYDGGGTFCDGTNSFTNCIFYENSSGGGRNIIISNGGKINYCAADENLYSTNSIRLYSSPFVENGLQLNNLSHCSNAGNPDTTGLNLTPNDLEGNNRIINDTIDIGAYESSYLSTPLYTLYDSILVNNNSSDVFVEYSLYWALAHIKDNGLITFDNDYHINITSEILPNDKNLIIDGGRNRIILDGGDSIRIFRFNGHYPAKNIKLKNLTIQHGYADSGGGLFIDPFSSTKLEVINCLFYKNSARIGGGAYVTDRMTPFYNCVFMENNASESGGGIYTHGNVKLINCSISNNHAVQNGGGVVLYNGYIYNSLIYGNHSTYNNNNIYDRTNSTITYCASEDDFSSYGENILLSEDPFVGINLNDSLMLKQGSVLINAGNPDTTGLNLPKIDFSLNSRIASDTIDIGAYEYFDHIISSSSEGEGKIMPELAHVVDGRNQKFEIVPSTGYKLDSLWIDDIFVDSTSSYTFYNVLTDHEVTAIFRLDTFNITIIAGENGSVTPRDTNITYLESVQYTIIPDEDYRIDSTYFGNINIINDLIHADNQYFYTVDSLLNDDTLRIAFYKPETYYIKTIVGENGTVTPLDTGITFFDTLQYTITPDFAYKIDTAIFGNKSIINDLIKKDNRYTYKIDSLLNDDTLHITFCPDTFKITTIIHGEGEISPMNITTTYFETTEISITPNWAYHIMSAKFGGNSILNELVEYEDSSVYILKDVFQDDTLEVTFVLDTCDINVIIEGIGTVTPMDTSVAIGQELEYYIYPLYNLLSVSYDGETYYDTEQWEHNDTTLYFHLWYVLSDGTLNVKFKENTTDINNNLNSEHVSIYPNPTMGKININLPDHIFEYKLLILDNSGKVLYNNPKYNERGINLHNYPSGSYFLFIEFDKKRFPIPIIKQ